MVTQRDGHTNGNNGGYKSSKYSHSKWLHYYSFFFQRFSGVLILFNNKRVTVKTLKDRVRLTHEWDIPWDSINNNTFLVHTKLSYNTSVDLGSSNHSIPALS